MKINLGKNADVMKLKYLNILDIFLNRVDLHAGHKVNQMIVAFKLSNRIINCWLELLLFSYNKWFTHQMSVKINSYPVTQRKRILNVKTRHYMDTILYLQDFWWYQEYNPNNTISFRSNWLEGLHIFFQICLFRLLNPKNWTIDL